MKKRVKGLTLMVVMTAFSAGLSLAAEEVPLARDMAAVIALHGLPCGQVVSVKRQGDNDHVASCQDGNRYRVFLNPEGRVVAQKL
jgi:hypothetical protein